MYLFRSVSLPDLGLYLCASLCWLAGGWLLVKHVFRLKSGEILIGGAAAGFLLFIALGNLLAPVLPLTAAFAAASGLIFAAGLLAAWKSSLHPWLKPDELWRPGQAAAFIALWVFFTLLGRGLSLFDDYLHLPLVSIMAAGDIPPHFYLDPSQYFAYHYGLQVFAASLVRMAGLFPWSAWDISKALAIAYTFSLAWLWFRRFTRSIPAAALGSFLIAAGGGARWLLLFLPGRIFNQLGNYVETVNTGADSGETLLKVMTGPWIIEGGGAMPFPFAFHSGIFVPITFVLGSTGAMPFMTVLLLLLLVWKWKPSLAASLVAGLIFATLALSAEHLFAFLWAGIALALLVYAIPSKPWLRTDRAGLIPDAFQSRLQRGASHAGQPEGSGFDRQAGHWAGILAFSALLSLVQGAFITEAARGLLLAETSKNFYGFALRWPPGLLSAHLGELSLFNPQQAVVLLAELGPALILAPLAAWYLWKQFRRRNWLAAGLGCAAWFSLIFPIIFRYGVDRSITRMPATALWLWLLFSFPVLLRIYKKAGGWVRFCLGSGYVAAVFGGTVILAIQMTGMPVGQLTYYVTGLDGEVSRAFWGRLPEGAQVFDPVPFRGVTLFGRASRAHEDIYTPIESYSEILRSGDAVDIAGAGYDYIYIDEIWWASITPERKASLMLPCAKVLADKKASQGVFRVLLDVGGCAENSLSLQDGD